jgi:hypothetical protein
MKRPTYIMYYGKKYSFRKTLNRILNKINSSIGYSIDINKMNKELDKNINFIFKMAKFVQVEPVRV